MSKGANRGKRALAGMMGATLFGGDGDAIACSGSRRERRFPVPRGLRPAKE